MPNKRRAKHDLPVPARDGGQVGVDTGVRLPRLIRERSRGVNLIRCGRKSAFERSLPRFALRHGKGTSDQVGFLGPSYRMSVTLLRLGEASSGRSRPPPTARDNRGSTSSHGRKALRACAGPGAHSLPARSVTSAGEPILADRDTGLVVRQPLQRSSSGRTQVRLPAGRVGTSPEPHPSPAGTTTGRRPRGAILRSSAAAAAPTSWRRRAKTAPPGWPPSVKGSKIGARAGARRTGGKRATTTYFLGDLTTAQARRIEWLRRPG